MCKTELLFSESMRRVRGLIALCVLFATVLSSVSPLAAANVNLAWDSSPAANLAGYVVRYGTASGQYTMVTNFGTVTSATVGGLQDGASYYFVVKALNTSGLESDPSNEVNATMPSVGAPTITTIANQTTLENVPTTVSFTVSSTAVPAGNLTLSASSSNTGLLPVANIVFGGSGSSRTAILTPYPGRSGTATVVITVSDGTRSASRSFTLSVNGINDPPTLNTIASVTVSEDSAAQSIALSGIGTGDINELQTLLVTATSSNPSLIPAPTISYSSPNASGTLSFAPAANANGTATITVSVNDGQLTSNLISRAFTVTVNPVNDAPTLNSLGSLNVAQSSGLRTVALSGIGSGAANESQSLSVTATSSNPGLIPNPTVTYASPGTTGTLAFTPVTGATGTATIMVTVNDGQAQNNSISRSFNVTVGGSANTLFVEAESGAITTPVTTFSDSTASGGQHVATQFDNQGALSLSVNLAQAGDYTIWCRVLSTNDNTDSFYVSVDGGADVTYGTAQNTWSPNWQWTRVNGDNGLSGSFQTFTLAAGSHTITFRGRESYTRLDALYVTSDPSFVPPAGGANTPPTLNAITSLTLAEDAAQQAVSLTGISPGAASETQTLSVTASSSNPSLIPTPTVTYSSPNTTGSLTFRPSANASGTATVSVTVNDGQALNNSVTRTFTVTVNPVNDLPTLSAIPDQSLPAGTASGTIGFTVGDVETAAGSLTLSASSSNPTLVPTTGILFGGSGSSRSVAVTPVAGQSGSANLTVTVSDGSGGSSSDTFVVSVAAPNPPPTIVLTSPSSGGSYVAPATVTLAASVNANGHTLNRVQFYQGSSWLGEVTAAPYAFTWTGLSAGSYSVTARLVYDGGSLMDSATVSFTVAGLPAPWQTTDIGSVSPGSASASGGVFNVSGAGNISGSADAFRFVYQTLSGDGEIRIRVNATGSTGSNGRAGVMIRETLTSGSRYAFMGLSPDGTFRWQRRSSTGGNTSSSTAGTGILPNTWVRLVRTGSTLTGYRSTDGVNWTKSDSRNISMASNIYIGLTVASGSSSVLNTSSFSGATVVP